MAEELMWCWNSPRNLFSSSPQMIMDMRSSDDPPINSGDWNHDFLRDIAKSEENNINYSNNFLLDSKSEDSGVNSISLLQTLLDTDSQPQQSLLVDMNSNGFLPPASEPNRNIWSWSSTAAAPSTFLPSPQSHFIPNHNHTPATYKPPPEQAKDSITTPLFKRPRIETPSPLPTFKVRKEKLGDRITALQQLVSPFGKTDTASVLHEAIDYIKFLHDQVNALSTPYLKYGSLPLQEDKAKDEQGLTKELKTRGLCLVPISSTFPVAAETTTDFWTPTFAGCFR